ncbi:MAG TPA: undecaprenyldiphospho-muramoylpentapeptide beta-N-acetylglucosaminyltransferase, partial [Mycobacteriales bacterium]|nr:undecaprenyldiphospho-muramoylpentapeptide beta-N-acetylglucosaminyltransferase [Mycobacteriales bacterium]
HVEPALAVADELRARGHRPVLLGTETGLETRLVPARGHELRTIPRVPLPRKPGADLLRLPARLSAAVRAAAAVIDDVGASAVVGFGGYVSAPAYLAARRHRRRHIGIVVHEANPLPGFANRLGARLTTHVAISVPGTPLRHAVLTGLPLRAAITGLDRAARRADARTELGLAPDRPALLVTGGSQGARRLNDAATGAARALSDAGVQVLHVAGPKNVDDVRAAVPADISGYAVIAYCDDMPAAYAAADLALCRAGAVTCAELAAVGLPAVYVPLPIGNGEQRRNAEPTVAAGGGVLVDDAVLTSDELLRVALPLLTAPDRLAAMGAAARRALPLDASARVADLAEQAAGVGKDGSS